MMCACSASLGQCHTAAFTMKTKLWFLLYLVCMYIFWCHWSLASSNIIDRKNFRLFTVSDCVVEFVLLITTQHLKALPHPHYASRVFAGGGRGGGGGLAVRYLQELMHVCSFPLSSKLCYTKVTAIVPPVSAVWAHTLQVMLQPCWKLKPLVIGGWYKTRMFTFWLVYLLSMFAGLYWAILETCVEKWRVAPYSQSIQANLSYYFG